MDMFDEVPIDRITDGDITIARLACGHHRFYAGHTVDVGQPVLCGEADHDHPNHPDGHGVTRIKQVVRTTTVTVTHVID